MSTTQIQIDDNNLHDLQNTKEYRKSNLSKETYRAAIKAFMTVNVIFIIGGMSVMYPIYWLNHHDGQVERTITLYTEETQVPVYLVYFSGSIVSINGCLGLFSAYFDTPLLFDSHEGFTFIALGLNLIASVTASMVPTRVSKDIFENLFQAEAYHFSQHPKFMNVCRGHHIWHEIQESLSCCGVLSPRDWIFSSLKALPTSCCNMKLLSKEECHALVGLDKNLSTCSFQKIKEEIFPYLWTKNCVDTLQELTGKRKFIWTLFPLGLLLFESFFMTYSALQVDFIRHYTDYQSKRELSSETLLGSTKLEKLKRQQVDLHIIESKISLNTSQSIMPV